jgi:plastocyanin
MTPVLRLARGPLVLVATLTLVACGSGDASQTATNTPSAPKPTIASRRPTATTTQAGATTVVHIKDDLFDPPKVEVKAGDTAVWHWDGKHPHNVDFDTFRSKVQMTGTFKKMFDQPGTFDYHCDVHPTMHASVVVT